MADETIDPWEIAAGFAALGIILVGAILLIVGAVFHDIPLPVQAQMVTRVLFGH